MMAEQTQTTTLKNMEIIYARDDHPGIKNFIQGFLRFFRTGSEFPQKDHYLLLDVISEMRQFILNKINSTPDSQDPMFEDQRTSKADQVYGFTGQHVFDNNVPVNPPEEITSKDMDSPLYQNPDEIIATMNKRCLTTDEKLGELNDKINHLSNISSGNLKNLAVEQQNGAMHYVTTMIEELNKNSQTLSSTKSLERRYQALAYARLALKKEFTCLDRSYKSFYTCVTKLQNLLMDNTVAQNQLPSIQQKLLGFLQQCAFTVEGGPDRTVRITNKKSSEANKLEVRIRFYGIDESSIKLLGDPILTVTSVDGSDRKNKCKVHFDQSDMKDGIWTISGITFKEFQANTSRKLKIYEQFYTLRWKQTVSVFGINLELEGQTHPFTKDINPKQMNECIAGVTWHIFSQGGQNSPQKPDVYSLESELPVKSVLQMFNLLTKSITKEGGKSLDDKELKELQRLLIRQQNSGSSVKMASICHNEMKHPRDSKKDADMEFTFFTWFRASLATLAKFSEYWKRGILLGFYSQSDCNLILTKAGRQKGDTVMRISQTTIEHPTAAIPFTDVTVQIVNDNKDIYVNGFSICQDKKLCDLLKQYVNNNKTRLVRRFVPGNRTFSEVFEGDMDKKTVCWDRYPTPFIREPETIIPLLRFENLTLEEHSPLPEDSLSLEEQSPPPNDSLSREKQSPPPEDSPFSCIDLNSVPTTVRDMESEDDEPARKKPCVECEAVNAEQVPSLNQDFPFENPPVGLFSEIPNPSPLLNGRDPFLPNLKDCDDYDDPKVSGDLEEIDLEQLFAPSGNNWL